jgi:CDP-paratose 2-epimerase
LKWADWRPGDQRAYVSDIRKLERALDWTPAIEVEMGIDGLLSWVGQNKEAFLSLNSGTP